MNHDTKDMVWLPEVMRTIRRLEQDVEELTRQLADLRKAKVTQQVAVGEVWDQPMQPPLFTREPEVNTPEVNTEADPTPPHGIARPTAFSNRVAAHELQAGDKISAGVVLQAFAAGHGMTAIRLQQQGPRISFVSTYKVKSDVMFDIEESS